MCLKKSHSLTHSVHFADFHRIKCVLLPLPERKRCCPAVHRTYVILFLFLILSFTSSLFPFPFPRMAESHWFISLSKCNSIRKFIYQSLYFTIWLYESMMEMSSSLSYFTGQSGHFMLGWEIHFFYWSSVCDVSLESYVLSFSRLSYPLLTETARGWIRGFPFTIEVFFYQLSLD